MSRLIAKIFQHANFHGHYRYIVQDINNFGSKLGFNDKVSSIIVYRGNNYHQGDKLRFYQDVNYEGGYLDLGPGYYRNIHVQPFLFGDKISSVDFLPYDVKPAITVRLRVRVYQHINYGGQYRDIISSEPNFKRIGFNDKVSSFRVFSGEDYQPGWVCDFYQHVNYAGGLLQGGGFSPGASIANIASPPYSFNDVISSVKFYKE